MPRTEPFFSIIVPTYQRPKRPAACLRALIRLNYPPKKYEVIIVDDGSEEPPEAIVAAIQNCLDITLLTQSNSGPAAARNAGALNIVSSCKCNWILPGRPESISNQSFEQMSA